jgi:hypothetical protein
MLKNDSLPQEVPGPSPTQQAIAAALAGLRYGSVEIVVHDGRIVQIERREKWRMDRSGAGPVSAPSEN